MFREYDVIVAIKNLSDVVLKGTKGTILIVHTSIPTAYEIEFINDQMESISVLTVSPNDIEIYRSKSTS